MNSNNNEAKRCVVRSGSVVNVMNSNNNTQICEKQIGQPPQLTDYLGVTGWGCEVGRGWGGKIETTRKRAPRTLVL